MKTCKVVQALAISFLVINFAIQAEMKKMHSGICIDKIPEAKAITEEVKKIQETHMAAVKEIQDQGGKIQEEINALVAKQVAMKPDEKFRAESQIKEKRRKLEELGTQYQRLMQDFESEMQMAQMRLQPFLVEVIQNAVEIAKVNPTIESLWDEGTRQFVYIKDTLDISAEVIKLTQKKNDQKSVLAKTKAVAPKTPAAKVA